MRWLSVCAALVALAAAGNVGASALPQKFYFSATFADGGFVDGFFVNAPAASDRCLPPGNGCFASTEFSFEGEYAYDGGSNLRIDPTVLFGEASIQQVTHVSPPEFRVRLNGRDDSRTNLAGSLGREMIVFASFAFAGTAADLPWSGDPDVVGKFLGGWVSNDLGYRTDVLSASLTPIPLPAGMWMMLSCLGVLGGWWRFARARERPAFESTHGGRRTSLVDDPGLT